MGAVQRLKREVCTFRFWKAVRAEFLGTLLLVYFGCGATLAVALPSAAGCEGVTVGVPALTVALAFGLSVAVVTQCTGHASGAHLNPALTLPMLAIGRISPARALLYTLAQIVGALSGSGLLIGVARQRLGTAAASNETIVAGGPAYFLPAVASDTHPGQAFGAEFMATFAYSFATFACMEQRRPVELGCRSVIVGLAVAMGHLVTLPLSGAGLNPVRCLGPALLTGSWRHHWLYWAGPLLGGLAGGLTCEYAQDSRSELHYLRRSLLLRRGGSGSGGGGVGGGAGGVGSGGGGTELTFTPSTTFENIRSA